MTWRFYLVFCLLPISGYAYYDPLSPRTARVSYSESLDAKRFPAGDVASPDYNYFISTLNFDAISGKIVTGAADKLYLLNLDLRQEQVLEWPTNSSLYDAPSTSTKCQDPPFDTYACRNHIRVFQTMPEEDRLLFVCGTQSTRQPQCRTVNITSGRFTNASTPQAASDGIISLHPDLPGFGEFRNQSNEVDHTFFSASFFRMTNARDYRISYQDVIPRNTTVLPTTVHNITVQNATEPEQRNTEQGSLVMRERFGDISGNNNWLRFPVTFVDYYRADYPVTPPATLPEHYQFYFVFLRENLFGSSQTVDIIYSRVVRICRNDRGSTSAMNGNYFNSYMKARIFCEREVPSQSSTEFVGAIDYQYNIIRSMAFNNRGGRFSEESSWNWLMYGAFTGPLIGPVGSAICMYSANNTGQSSSRPGLFDVYRGDFSGSGVVNDFVECDPNGRSDDDARDKVLIGADITQIGEDPILAFDGFYISQMVVDTVCVVRSQNTRECRNQDVLFLGTSDGRILKVVFATNGTQTSPVFSEDIALDDDNTVNNLQLEMVNGHKHLFANTWSRIYHLPLNRCNRFSSCSDCIESRDPYCVWNTRNEMCQLSDLTALADGVGAVPDHKLQDIHNGNSSLCNTDTSTPTATASPTSTTTAPTGPTSVLFQIGLTGPSCKNWINSSIASKTRTVVATVVSAVNGLCSQRCNFTSGHIQNAGFRCGQNDNIVVFRGELISTQQSSPSVLRDYVQDWVRRAPEFLVQNIYFKVDPLCPTAIETLRDPACDEGSSPSTGGVTAECNTGATATGWVFAVLELIIIIVLGIILGIIVYRWYNHRSRKSWKIRTPGEAPGNQDEEKHNVQLKNYKDIASPQSTLTKPATTTSEEQGKLNKEKEIGETETKNGLYCQVMD